MRRVVAPLAVLAAAAALGGCLHAPAPPDASSREELPTRRPPSDGERIEALLERRARALRDGNPRAYAATAAGAQRRRDRVAARRARGLGLRRVALVLTGSQLDGARATVQIRLRYAVRGVSGMYGSRRTLRLRRTQRGWRVVRDGARRQRPPWEVGEFDRTTTRHFVVWAPERRALGPRGLIWALEEGYARMRGLLANGRLRRRYLVVVAADPAQALRLTARIRGLESLTALTDTEIRVQGPAQRVASVESQRLLVVWSSFAELGMDDQRTVVAHELTHAVLAPATSGRTPGWVTEGVALYVSGDDRTPEAASRLAGGDAGAALRLAALSRPDAVGRLEGEEQAAAYAYSSAAAHYIVDRHGRDRLLRLYDAYNRVRLEGDAGDARLTDAALRAALGVGLERFERDLRAWIAQRAP